MGTSESDPHMSRLKGLPKQLPHLGSHGPRVKSDRAAMVTHY